MEVAVGVAGVVGEDGWLFGLGPLFGFVLVLVTDFVVEVEVVVGGGVFMALVVFLGCWAGFLDGSS